MIWKSNLNFYGETGKMDSKMEMEVPPSLILPVIEIMQPNVGTE